MWFARDIHTNEISHIVNAEQRNNYTCPICNSEVIPKALESIKVTPHFAHIDRSKCSGESMVHFWYKHKFIEHGDTFTIKTDKEIQFTCKDYKVEVEYELESGTYRPDLVVYTECGNEIIFEMANTNKKKVQDYIDRWIELDKIIVEVDVKNLINNEKVFNALYYKGKCFNFNSSEKPFYETYMSIKSQTSIIRDIEKVKNVEWFWLEINNQQVEDEILFEVFELFTISEKDIFIKSSHKLTKLFISRFLLSKRRKIIDEYRHLEGFIDFFRTNRSMSIYSDGNRYCAITKTSLNLYYENLEGISRRIENYYKSSYDLFSEHKIYNWVKNCKNLTLAIKDLDIDLKQLNEKYEILLDNDSYYKLNPTIHIKYGDKSLFNMKINENLMKKFTKEKIYHYLKKKIVKHTSSKENEILFDTFSDRVVKINKLLKTHNAGDRKNPKFYNFEVLDIKPSEKRLILKLEDVKIYSLNVNLKNVDTLSLTKNIFNNDKLKCNICDNEIYMTNAFLSRLIENNYCIPKRCKNCKVGFKKKGE